VDVARLLYACALLVFRPVRIAGGVGGVVIAGTARHPALDR